jgi:effector-binding domain-containing protein
MRIEEISRADLQEQTVAVVRAHVDLDGIGAFVGSAFGEVVEGIEAQGRHPTGMPFARYHRAADGWDVVAGFPVDVPVAPRGRVEPDTLPGGQVAHVLYRGPYDGVAAAYEALTDAIRESGDVVTGDPWECYLDEPDVAEPRTEVFVPCGPAVPAGDG